MKFKFLVFLLVFAGPYGLNAAKLNLKWSKAMAFDGKEFGYFHSFVGNNQEYIYALVRTYSIGSKIDKHRLIAFDPATMMKMQDVVLVDPKVEKTKGESQFKGLYYYQTIIFNDVVYVFWKKSTKLLEELFVQSFDADLNVQQPLKKVYEVNNLEDRKAKDAEIIVLHNKNVPDKLLIGAELPAMKGQVVQVEYRLLNKDLSFSASDKVSLPYEFEKGNGSLTSTYIFGEDGNLHIKSLVRDEVDAGDKKSKSKSHSYFTKVDLTTGKISAVPLKFEDKTIFEFKYQIKAEYIYFYGFYCDLTRDLRGQTTHGIFTAQVDNESYSMSNVNFSPFEKKLLDELYATDKIDQNKAKKKKDKEKGKDESISNLYTIEYVDILPGGEFVIFCSIMNNYSVTTCDDKGRCRTRYYCQRKNVTAFKIGNSGEIIWASNLNRSYTYPQWYVHDVKVVKKDGNYFVVYGSATVDNAGKKSGESSKKFREIKNTMEYAIFDGKSGKFKKEIYQVNTANTPKKEKKFIYVPNIYVLQDRLVSYYLIKKGKIGFFANIEPVAGK